MQCSVDDDEIDETLTLLEDLVWLGGLTRVELRSSVRGSTARVAARDAGGRIVAFARAVSDGKCAWIYDVAVAAHLRNTHLGSAVMGVLLDHPAVRGARHVRLSTRDAMPFYRRLGFCTIEEAPRFPWTSTEMIRTRATAPSASERTDETDARGGLISVDSPFGRALLGRAVDETVTVARPRGEIELTIVQICYL